MSNKEEVKYVDLRWLSEGKEDPHPRYVEIGREELSAPDVSDDELAYMISISSTISENEDLRRMLDSHKNKTGYIPKGILVEVCKDRIRWLSRRVAVLEGRYPNMDSPGKTAVEEAPMDTAEILAEAVLKGLLGNLSTFLGVDENTPVSKVSDILIGRCIGVRAPRVKLVLGLTHEVSYVKRLHVCIEMIRGILKNSDYYIPFDGDEYSEYDGLLLVSKSDYHTVGTYKCKNLKELFPVKSINIPILDELNALVKKKKVILEFWYTAGDAKYWSNNWCGENNSLLRIIEWTLNDIKETNQRIIIEADEGEDYSVSVDTFAKLLYNTWNTVKGFKPWVPNGNSEMQDKARKQIIEELTKEVK